MPWPKGWWRSAGRRLRDSPSSIKPALPVSTTEWMASAIIAVLRVMRPTMSLVAAMPRFAAIAPTSARLDDAAIFTMMRRALGGTIGRSPDCVPSGSGGDGDEDGPGLAVLRAHGGPVDGAGGAGERLRRPRDLLRGPVPGDGAVIAELRQRREAARQRERVGAAGAQPVDAAREQQRAVRRGGDEAGRAAVDGGHARRRGEAGERVVDRLGAVRARHGDERDHRRAAAVA